MLPVHTLNDGRHIPAIGLGTFQMRQVAGDDVIHRTLDTAIQCGYRLVDTAAVYHNEADIGHSLKQILPKYGLSRADIFITSKLCECFEHKLTIYGNLSPVQKPNFS